mmetsp:Transcript_156983/g.500728  ORF Transcript_156983/g.500728 Transcript_156983/m.500728 type:complete len:87 (-) Transcript_156983:140-400(-)
MDAAIVTTADAGLLIRARAAGTCPYRTLSFRTFSAILLPVREFARGAREFATPMRFPCTSTRLMAWAIALLGEALSVAQLLPLGSP